MVPPIFKNISPLGELDIPSLGRLIAPGERFEVTEADAPYFDGQSGTFERIAAKAPKTPKPSGRAGADIETKSQDAAPATPAEIAPQAQEENAR